MVDTGCSTLDSGFSRTQFFLSRCPLRSGRRLWLWIVWKNKPNLSITDMDAGIAEIMD